MKGMLDNLSPVQKDKPTPDAVASLIKKDPLLEKKKSAAKVPWSKRKKIIVISLAIALAIAATLGFYTAAIALEMKQAALEAKNHGSLAYQAVKNQDLVIAKEELLAAQGKINDVDAGFSKLKFWSFGPLYWHYQDGRHGMNATKAGIEAGLILIEAVEPYADVIGFTGQGSFVGGTAEDRIVKIVETLDKVNPSLDAIVSKLNVINEELESVNPARYPFKIQGQSVSDLIGQAKNQVHQATLTINDIKPILAVLPQIAGVQDTKKYLVLFQNDAELRPTGGFMTAYAILNVEKGKVSPVKSDDIYSLDEKFKKRLDPPDPIKNYLPLVYYWYLRDMNISPDFKLSMEQFLPHYSELPGEEKDISGVITVDTQVLSDLITVLGPVEVPGYGVFTGEIDARCDCPQVIYALEEISTKPTPYIRRDRKAVLGPLMQTILLKAYGSPKQIWPSLFETIWRNINEKHVLFYFHDEVAQQAAETNNFAGRIQAYDGDYLHVNDANFGGAKSNMFVSQEIEDEVTLEYGIAVHKLTVIYKNPHKGSNCNLEAGQLCLNGVLRDFVRFYVPSGVEVKESLGFDEDTVKSYTELDKSVVEGFFTLAPQAQAKLQLTYTVPYNNVDAYKIYLQKQPGKKTIKYTLVVNGDREEFDLVKDQEVVIDLK